MTVRLFTPLLFGLVFSAAGAVAQPVPGPHPNGPRCDWPAEFEGRDPSGLTLDQALDALLAFELDINGMEDTMGRAVLYGTPAQTDRLKAVVETWTCYPHLVMRALMALRLIGEPEAYFREIVDRTAVDSAGKRRYISYFALGVLLMKPDLRLHQEYRPTLASFAGFPPMRNHTAWFERNLVAYGTPPDDPVTDISWMDTQTPLVDRVYDVSENHMSELISGGLYDVARDSFYLTEMYSTFEESHGADIWRFRALARSHPSLVAAAIDEVVRRNSGPKRTQPFFVEPDPGGPEDALFPPGAMARVIQTARAIVERSTPGLLDPPPVTLSASVVPVAECVRQHTSGLSAGLSARFGYTYDGPPARIPPGPNNRLSARDGEQPEGFYSGGIYDLEFYVPLEDGETVAWTLLGQTVAAGAASPRCDGTDPLVFGAVPAAVTLADAADVRLNGNALSVSGWAHDLSGDLTDDAPRVAALASRDNPDLSDRQRRRLIGGVSEAPLVISPSSWAARLAEAATVTVGDRPLQTLGSSDAPVVAYAPSGIQLDGRFQGWGVLVVDGPLTLRGGARWTGLVIVRGRANLEPEVDVIGTPSIVGGLVLADGASLSLGGRAEVLYSPAALALARRAALAE